MRILFVLLVCLSLSGLKAQDTLSVYFNFGSSKINKEYRSLNAVLKDYNLSDVDSIQFIGYADSVGKSRANLNLSLKRGANVYEFCKGTIGEDIPVAIIARGEGPLENPALNRRVDIILYYKVIPEEGISKDEIVKDVVSDCFYIDYNALDYCHTSEIVRKKKKYIQIEAPVTINFPLRKLYYVVSGKDGKYNVRRVSWKKKITGHFWWRKKRYVALVPKESFDDYKIFVLRDGPCEKCSVDWFGMGVLITKLEYRPDMFLMQNFQARFTIRKRKYLKIRVPKEYVNQSEPYFYGTEGWYKQLEWTTKRIGVKRKRYYYTKLANDGVNFSTIYRRKSVSECVFGGAFGVGSFFPCCLKPSFGPSISLGIEPGVFYQNDTITGFLAANLSLANARSRLNLKLGVNTNFSLYSSINYRFNCLSFPLYHLALGSKWKSSADYLESGWMARLFVGTELKTSFRKKTASFIEQNAHLGLAIVNTNYRPIITGAYIYSGIGYDFLQRTNQSAYGLVQVGVTFSLFNWK